MEKQRTPWMDIVFSCLAGGAVGALIPLIGVPLGLPRSLVGPLGGGIAAPLIYFVYVWRRARAGAR